MTQKYFKPRSLTWWSGFVPLFCGLFIAAEPIHGFVDWVQAIRNATGMSAPVLINIGFGIIGIRGAM